MSSSGDRTCGCSPPPSATDNEENIELVPEKAKAGYAAGFADPEYISILPYLPAAFPLETEEIPDFPGQRATRCSPFPTRHGSPGVYVQDWSAIRDKDAYIILTAEEGIVFKVVENRIRDEGKLILHSLNPDYKPFDIAAKDIREIWQFVHFISGELPDNEMASARRTDPDSKGPAGRGQSHPDETESVKGFFRRPPARRNRVRWTPARWKNRC